MQIRWCRIQQYTLPGTTIVSNCWAASNHTCPCPYQQLGMRSKVRFQKERGTKNGLLDSHIIEFMWRQVATVQRNNMWVEIRIHSEHATV